MRGVGSSCNGIRATATPPSIQQPADTSAPSKPACDVAWMPITVTEVLAPTSKCNCPTEHCCVSLSAARRWSNSSPFSSGAWHDHAATSHSRLPVHYTDLYAQGLRQRGSSDDEHDGKQSAGRRPVRLSEQAGRPAQADLPPKTDPDSERYSERIEE